MNLTVPGAVSALEAAFSGLLAAGCEGDGLAGFERRALAIALATMCGDVSFSRTVLLDEAGCTSYPLDDELGLPYGDRVSPAAREFLATCGADVPYARTARLLEMAGGSSVSAVTVMGAVRAAGAAVAEGQREAARALCEDGVAPETEPSAGHVLLEADGTYVRMRDGSVAEVKAAVAYAGKREDGSRADPVRIGCVGEAPGDFWEQTVAQAGRRFDLAGVERVSLGTDREAQYVNGRARLPFREVDGLIDPFHVIRAAASCARDRKVGGSCIAGMLRCAGPEAAADLIEGMIEDGDCREWAGEVTAYMGHHAPRSAAARRWARWRPSSSTCTR